MSELYFIFNGADSREKGIRVNSLPARIMPARRYEEHTVPARSGTVRIWDGAYECIQLPVGIYLPYGEDEAIAELYRIMRLLDGTGWLELSDRPGRRFEATVIGGVPYSAWVQGFEQRLATIAFEAQPWAYLPDNDPVAVESSGQYVANNGSQTAEPVIELTGSGDIILMIGQQITEMKGIDGTVVIDVPAGRVTHNGESENIMSGDLPILQPGQNAVSWTGTVTSLSITVNARDIGW